MFFIQKKLCNSKKSEFVPTQMLKVLGSVSQVVFKRQNLIRSNRFSDYYEQSLHLYHYQVLVAQMDLPSSDLSIPEFFRAIARK